MKIIVNSFAVDVFLNTLRVVTTVEAHGVEENFNFFFPFDSNKKPSCDEMAAMVRDAKKASHTQFMTNWFGSTEPTNPEAEEKEESEESKAADPAKKRGRKPKVVEAPAPVVETPVEAPAPVVETPVEAPAPVEAPPTLEPPTLHPALLEVEGVIFDRTDKMHANIVGSWFAEANPMWRNSPESIALCKGIALAMTGHMFLQSDSEGKVSPIEEVKAKAIESVKQGKSLF